MALKYELTELTELTELLFRKDPRAKSVGANTRPPKTPHIQPKKAKRLTWPYLRQLWGASQETDLAVSPHIPPAYGAGASALAPPSPSFGMQLTPNPQISKWPPALVTVNS